VKNTRRAKLPKKWPELRSEYNIARYVRLGRQLITGERRSKLPRAWSNEDFAAERKLERDPNS
jgi:hypothetical protein